MGMTRRAFTVNASAVALTVLGCDSGSPATTAAAGGEGNGGDGGEAASNDSKKANLAKEPFLIGASTRFTRPGLYQDFKSDKGVWLVSDGKTLVALSATCTHLGCTTHWQSDRALFECPCHESLFSLEGMNRGGKSKRPMERCAMRIVESDSGPQIEVDPTRRFRHERGEWDDPASTLTLNEP